MVEADCGAGILPAVGEKAGWKPAPQFTQSLTEIFR
jgi:hypothetical protein